MPARGAPEAARIAELVLVGDGYSRRSAAQTRWRLAERGTRPQERVFRGGEEGRAQRLRGTLASTATCGDGWSAARSRVMWRMASACTRTVPTVRGRAGGRTRRRAAIAGQCGNPHGERAELPRSARRAVEAEASRWSASCGASVPLLGRTRSWSTSRGALKAWMRAVRRRPATASATHERARSSLISEQRTLKVSHAKQLGPTRRAGERLTVRALAYVVFACALRRASGRALQAEIRRRFRGVAQQTVCHGARAARPAAAAAAAAAGPAPPCRARAAAHRALGVGRVENVPDAVQEVGGRAPASSHSLQTRLRRSSSPRQRSRRPPSRLPRRACGGVTPHAARRGTSSAASRRSAGSPVVGTAAQPTHPRRLAARCAAWRATNSGSGARRHVDGDVQERLDRPQLDVGRGVAHRDGVALAPPPTPVTAFAIPQLNAGLDRRSAASEAVEKMDRLGRTTSLCDLTRHATIHIEHRGHGCRQGIAVQLEPTMATHVR